VQQKNRIKTGTIPRIHIRKPSVPEVKDVSSFTGFFGKKVIRIRSGVVSHSHALFVRRYGIILHFIVMIGSEYRQALPAFFAASFMGFPEIIFRHPADDNILRGASGAGEPDNISAPGPPDFRFYDVLFHRISPFFVESVSRLWHGSFAGYLCKKGFVIVREWNAFSRGPVGSRYWPKPFKIIILSAVIA